MPEQPILTEDQQRKFQADAWRLPVTASWQEIDHAAAVFDGKPTVFYDYQAWREVLTRMYGPILPT